VRIAVIDFETDPFKHGRVPMPFACGFYDGDEYVETWGDCCVKEMLGILKAYTKPLVIFAHNGGRFDFWFIAHEIREPLLFIDSRLVQAKLYHHEIRDSYKILPVPLAEWNKETIDYRLMEKDTREKHHEVISKYLKSDCLNLYDAVSRFIMTFGNVLTVGAAAMRELRKDYRIESIGAAADGIYRPYFHGGRTEVFEVGEIHGEFKLYDVNSMYPDVMARFEHPIGSADYVGSQIPKDAPFFLAHICAKSKGAFPLRTKDGLAFPHGHREFFVTSHELRMAERLKLCEVTEVLEVHAWEETRTFEKFVNRFAAAKVACEESGDYGGRLLNKLISNNAYGKFATNPERFKQYRLFDSASQCCAQGYEVEGEIGPKIIGVVPAKIKNKHYYNVATAASITGAARAVLLHALSRARRPVYCDTDSVWCTALPLELNQTKLGAWKLEQTADTLFIAGKKLYAARRDGNFYETKKGARYPMKCASKGVSMKPEEIARVARGEIIKIPIEAPSLRIGQKAKFIARSITRTAKTA
jgi:hypothetical protein